MKRSNRVFHSFLLKPLLFINPTILFLIHFPAFVFGLSGKNRDCCSASSSQAVIKTSSAVSWRHQQQLTSHEYQTSFRVNTGKCLCVSSNSHLIFQLTHHPKVLQLVSATPVCIYTYLLKHDPIYNPKGKY